MEISISFDSKNILKDINLEFPIRGFYTIVGESGSGKTTLLNLISGKLKPLKGQILFNEVDITKLEAKALTNFQNNNISYVFQDNNILENLSVKDNINIIHSSDVDVSQIMKKLKIDDIENKKVSKLSSGQRQKVKIAMALAKNTNVILCDEPIAHLDKESKLEILQIFKEISQTKLIIFVTHEIDFIKEISDDILVIKSHTIHKRKEKTESLFVEKQKKIIIDKFILFKLIIHHFSANKLKGICTIIIGILTFFFLILLLSIQSVDKIEQNTLKNEVEKKVYIEKNKMDEEEYYIDNTAFSKSELKEIEDKLMNKSFLQKGDRYYEKTDLLKFEISPINNSIYYKYDLSIPTFYELDESFMLVVGNYPKEKNEILISSCFADYILNSLINSRDGLKNISSYDELLTTEIYFGNFLLKISGIYYQPIQKYEILKKLEVKDNYSNVLIKDFEDVIILNANNIYTNKKFNNYLKSFNDDVHKDLAKIYIIVNPENVKNITKNIPIKNSRYTRVSSYTERISNKVTSFMPNYILIIFFTILFIGSLIIMIINYIWSSFEINKKEIETLKKIGIKKTILQQMLFLEIFYCFHF